MLSRDPTSEQACSAGRGACQPRLARAVTPNATALAIRSVIHEPALLTPREGHCRRALPLAKECSLLQPVLLAPPLCSLPRWRWVSWDC